MKFIVSGKVLTLGDLIAMEGGKLSVMRDIMAKCLVDDGGAILPFSDAVSQINAIPLDEFEDISNQFRQALEQYKAGTLPPTGGGK